MHPGIQAAHTAFNLKVFIVHPVAVNTVYGLGQPNQSIEKWTLIVCIRSIIHTVIFMLVLFTEIYKQI